MPSDRKTIKVVDLISEFRLVLNTGANDGTKIGDRFDIVGYGKMIKDPDSGEDLEQLELYRGEAKVVYLQDRICTVQSARTRQVRRPKSAFAGVLAFSQQDYETVTETAPFDAAQIGDTAFPVEK